MSNTFYSQKLFLHLIFEVHIVELSATSIMLAISFSGFQHPLFYVLQSYFLYNLILTRRISVFHSMYVKTWNFLHGIDFISMKCLSLMKCTKKYFFYFSMWHECSQEMWEECSKALWYRSHRKARPNKAQNHHCQQ